MADTKDWTWVLEQRCPECGFDGRRAGPGPDRRHHPSGGRRGSRATSGATTPATDRAPDVWSDLEYGCHLRDVGRIFGERLQLMLDEDGPQFANWDQDETAQVDRYDLQDPAVVAVELAASLGRPSPMPTTPCSPTSGTAGASARTGRSSRSSRSVATWSTTSCTTSGTSTPTPGLTGSVGPTGRVSERRRRPWCGGRPGR